MFKNIKQIKNLKNKTALLRADLDVPIKNGKIIDNFRLTRLLPTIKYLIKEGANIFIIGHLGRPDGKIVKRLSMKPVAEELSKLLNVNKKEIKKFREKDIQTLKEKKFKHFVIDKNICLIENLRFYKEEEINDLKFSKKLVSLADFYVNEAFANSHRKHASIIGVSKLLPSYAGFNLEKEVKYLSRIIKNPRKPAIAIIGGVKLETKLPLINKLRDNFDYILVGGRLGIEMKKLSSFLTIIKKSRGRIIFPVDYSGDGKFDIGNDTIKLYSKILSNAKTIIWNGPMGKFEDKKYINGTRAIANAIKESKSYSVVGGGDVISALNKFKMLDEFNFVSTGGGAMLKFLENGDLVGLKELRFKI